MTTTFPAARSENKKRKLQDISTCQHAVSLSANTTPSSLQPLRSLKRFRLDKCDSTDSEVKPSNRVGFQAYGVNDVLSGRGGATNQHEGNCYFRILIHNSREEYLLAEKNDKLSISLSIVNAIRQRDGRFLKKDRNSNLWYEIGDAAAREKTSQALRQHAPEYRKQISEKNSQYLGPSNQHQPMHSSISSTTTKASLGIKILPSMTTPTTRARSRIPSFPPNNDALIILAINARIQKRVQQLRKAQEALLLQQKVDAIILLKLCLKQSKKFENS